MKAAWYESQGSAFEVLIAGEMATPDPGPGEVRIRVAASGVNPGDVKKRQDTFGVGMPYNRVIPHSDGAGVIDKVGHSNIGLDETLLAQGGSIATYATDVPEPTIPFWPLVFKNVRLFFLGSDDFPLAAKIAAAQGLNDALRGDWPGIVVEKRLPLESIAEAHEMIEKRRLSGRIVLSMQGNQSAV